MYMHVFIYFGWTRVRKKGGEEKSTERSSKDRGREIEGKKGRKEGKDSEGKKEKQSEVELSTPSFDDDSRLTNVCVCVNTCMLKFVA